MASGLQVENFSVSYDPDFAVRAVDSVSFSLNAGESLAILGPSGSGKSSLLMGLLGAAPSRGAVTWEGEDVTRSPIHLRRIGLVFQDGVLFDHLTVAQNIAFGLEAQGMNAEARQARVSQLLEMTEMSDFAHRNVTQLSGGQRQRVAIARALAPNPRMIMLDEPLSSLDSALRSKLAADIKALLTSNGTTWILVTHDLNEAEAMADAVAHMHEGRLRT